MIQSNSKLRGAFSGGELYDQHLLEAMAHQLDLWSRGASGLDVEENFKVEPLEGGQLNFRYGAWSIGVGTAGQTGSVKKAIASFEKELANTEEYRDLTKKLNQAASLREDIQEELDTITLRRVIPGRCRYCPV